MAQRFVICTDSGGSNEVAASVIERNRITRALRRKGWEVWHWFEDVWLVVNPSSESILTSVLREQLSALMDEGKSLLILEVESRDWAGVADEKSWDWMNRKWK